MEAADAVCLPACNRGAGRDVFWLVCVGLAMAAAFRPFQTTPFLDDWAYAWPVQRLLESGELLVPEYSNPSLVLMLYGAVVCLPFGFSFIALGASTWLLWIALQVILYLLVRELGGSRRNAWGAALAIAMYPTCLMLAPTFMTEVPFLTAETAAALIFVRALQRRRESLVWAASSVAFIATGVRGIGVAVPIAMTVTLLLHAGSWGRRARVLVAPLVSVLGTPILLLVADAHRFVSADVSYLPNAPVNRMRSLGTALEILPETIPATVMLALLQTGAMLLPIALGMVTRANRRAFAAVVVACGAAVVSPLLTPWHPGQIGDVWTLGEAGKTPSLVAGWTPYVDPPYVIQLVIRAVSFASLGVLAATFRDGRPRAADWFAGWSIVGLVLISSLFWLFSHDRYGLVFVPIAAAAIASRIPPVRIPLTLSGVIAFGIVGIVSLQDQRAYDHALWSAVARLRSAGVPVAEIDGGYTVNAWLQYLNPDQAHRAPDGRIAIPLFNDDVRLRYTISNSPLPDTAVVETVPFAGWWRSGQLYVLRRIE
jgi:hypothetical protein